MLDSPPLNPNRPFSHRPAPLLSNNLDYVSIPIGPWTAEDQFQTVRQPNKKANRSSTAQHRKKPLPYRSPSAQHKISTVQLEISNSASFGSIPLRVVKNDFNRLFQWKKPTQVSNASGFFVTKELKSRSSQGQKKKNSKSMLI